MKSEVIVLDRGLFSEAAHLPKKSTEVQNNHQQLNTMTEKKDGAKLLLSLIITI